MIPKQSKLLLLFFSKENPLWKEIIRKTVTQKEISKTSGISQSTISNWRKGSDAAVAHVRHDLGVFKSNLQKRNWPSKEQKAKIVATIDRFLDQLTANDPDVRVYDVAVETLSMTMQQCQKILDEIIYERFTLFPMLSYNSERAANDYFLKYGGSYVLWTRRIDKRDSGETALWLKSPMQVRYPLRVGAQHFIRCKLNAPIFSTEPGQETYWEYDGFLRTRDSKLFWIFEKRENLGSDFFHAITEEGRIYQSSDGGDPRLTMSGTYLTTGQDAARSIEHTDVLLQRLSLPRSGKEKDEDIARWMHSGAAILDPRREETQAEFQRVEQLWREFAGL
jgi:transcriptional regulator with XRE-family HTH domain